MSDIQKSIDTYILINGYFLIHCLWEYLKFNDHNITKKALSQLLIDRGYEKISHNVSILGKKIRVTGFIVRPNSYLSFDKKQKSMLLLGLNPGESVNKNKPIATMVASKNIGKIA